VNEAFAQRFFPHQNAVGQKLLLGVVTAHPEPTEIVGVVANIREFGLDTAPEPTMYSLDVSPRMDVLIEASGNPAPLAALITAALRRIGPQSAIGPVRALSDFIDSSLARQRFALSLMAVFAGLAIVLCTVGIYGVFGYSVTRRLREFGIRSAIGAQRRDLLTLILRECLVIVVPGLIAGMLITFACSQFLRALLYRVSPTDALSYAIAMIAVFFLCLASAAVPAIRAAQVDPTRVLREQ
jgi:predicted lysophospholipase L1 biosynthesis ABC-type transport system permease subunit